jgi:putative transposase
VAREVGVSKHTIYGWKAKYGGMDVSQAQEAKQLRDEIDVLRVLLRFAGCGHACARIPQAAS